MYLSPTASTISVSASLPPPTAKPHRHGLRGLCLFAHELARLAPPRTLLAVVVEDMVADAFEQLSRACKYSLLGVARPIGDHLDCIDPVKLD